MKKLTRANTASPILQSPNYWWHTTSLYLTALLSLMLSTGCSQSSPAAELEGEILPGPSISPPPKLQLTIRKAVRLYWIPSEASSPIWLEGQIYAESGFNPRAKSSAGALGLAQFLPSTWGDLPLTITRGSSPYDEVAAIHAAAYYMRTLRDEWYRPRPELDRMSLARASYNAGLGVVLRAQVRSGDKTSYSDILPHLPRETQGYEFRIRRYVVDRM